MTDSISIGDEESKKNIQGLLGTIDRRIHRAIELDQLIVLTSELLRERLEKVSSSLLPLDSTQFSEDLEPIVSKCEEHAGFLYQIRKALKEEFLNPLGV